MKTNVFFCAPSVAYLCGMKDKNSYIFIHSFRKLLIGMRKEKMVTQMALSKRAGIARQTISDIERGKRTVLVSTFLELAAGLGMTSAQLMYEFEKIYNVEYSAMYGQMKEEGSPLKYIERIKSGSHRRQKKLI